MDQFKGIPENYFQTFELAEYTFLHQRVYDPLTKKIIPLSPLPEQVIIRAERWDWDFLGKEIDDEILINNIVTGDICPIDYRPMSLAQNRSLLLSDQSSLHTKENIFVEIKDIKQITSNYHRLSLKRKSIENTLSTDTAASFSIDIKKYKIEANLTKAQIATSPIKKEEIESLQYSPYFEKKVEEVLDKSEEILSNKEEEWNKENLMHEQKTSSQHSSILSQTQEATLIVHKRNLLPSIISSADVSKAGSTSTRSGLRQFSTIVPRSNQLAVTTRAKQKSILNYLTTTENQTK